MKQNLIILLTLPLFILTSCEQSVEENVLKAMFKDIGENKSAAYITDKYYVLDERLKETYMKEVYTEDYFDRLYIAIKSPKNISTIIKEKNVVTLITNQNDSILFLFQGTKIKSSVQMVKGVRAVGWI